jgi:transcriptional regulator with XRE-family HTH domain
MEQPGDTIAANLRAIREDRNLSLDQLSEMTGVSKSMLRQIEIGQSNPTIATIWKIANGLHIPFTVLLRKQSPEITLKDFKEQPPLTGNSDNYRVYPLTTFTPERAFETYYVEIEPGETFDAEPHQGNAEEHVFVFHGHLLITVADQSFTVGPEQFLSFQAGHHHRYENTGDERAIVMMLISYLP